jgi:hypothetical protein
MRYTSVLSMLNPILTMYSRLTTVERVRPCVWQTKLIAKVAGKHGVSDIRMTFDRSAPKQNTLIRPWPDTTSLARIDSARTTCLRACADTLVIMCTILLI